MERILTKFSDTTIILFGRLFDVKSIIFLETFQEIGYTELTLYLKQVR